MPLATICLRGDIKAHWESVNPILKQREVGVEWKSVIGDGKVKVKFGNGTTAWNDLGYGIMDDITKKAIESFVPTSGNNALAEGDTMDVIAGKLNAQREYWNTLTGAERAQAFFDSLAGLSNDDFVGVMTWLNSKKLDANMVYNGTDSSNVAQALAAPVGKQLKELSDTNTKAISTLNSNFGVNKAVVLKNNVNGFAYIEDSDIHVHSTIIANTTSSIDNTYIHSVIVAGEGLAVIWFSSFNENQYGVNYRVFN